MTQPGSQNSWQPLLDIIAQLRSPSGCPWDRAQTAESLLPSLIEETYELVDAVLEQSDDHISEEIGDLLLVLLLQAQIAEERGAFTIEHCLQRLIEKLIRRHPHVFGEAHAATVADVLTNWNAIKATEHQGSQKPPSSSLLKLLPEKMPALDRAYLVQAHAAKVGFDWTTCQEVAAKVREEYEELMAAAETNDPGRIEEEAGDLIFAVVNLHRFLKVQPEAALRKTVTKFIRRFSYIEQQAGDRFGSLSLQEMDVLWEQAKKLEPGYQPKD